MNALVTKSGNYMSRDTLNEVLHGPIHAQIGKNGLTKSVVSQIQALVKKRGMIKVSVVKALAEVKTPSKVALEAEQLTKCFLVEVRGRTFILTRKRIPLKRKRRGLKI